MTLLTHIHILPEALIGRAVALILILGVPLVLGIALLLPVTLILTGSIPLLLILGIALVWVPLIRRTVPLLLAETALPAGIALLLLRRSRPELGNILSPHIGA